MPGWVCSRLSDPQKLLSSTKSRERIDLHQGDLDCCTGDGSVSFWGHDVPKQAHVNKHCTRPAVMVFIRPDLQREILSSCFLAGNISLSANVFKDRARPCLGDESTGSECFCLVPTEKLPCHMNT